MTDQPGLAHSPGAPEKPKAKASEKRFIRWRNQRPLRNTLHFLGFSLAPIQTSLILLVFTADHLS